MAVTLFGPFIVTDWGLAVPDKSPLKPAKAVCTAVALTCPLWYQPLGGLTLVSLSLQPN